MEKPMESLYKPGERIFGQYLIHQVLQGGMGEVYLCLWTEANHPFALKTLQARRLADKQFHELFQTEVATWIALGDHPNIVRCHFMQIIDNRPFMFLDWIIGDEARGTALSEWLRAGPLEPRLALDFTIDICHGLIHAQKKQPGIVHRDLKPGNVLVTAGHVAKITDFGLATIARTVESTSVDGTAQAANAGGTPRYMAPEQWRGDVVDARTDIYTLGCILYELLTGRPPYVGAALEQLRRQHLDEPPPILSGDSTIMSMHLVMQRCLAKRREERFVSVDDLLQELVTIYRQVFSHEPRTLEVGVTATAPDYANRAATFMRLERPLDALTWANRALELDSSYQLAYEGRAAVYEQLKRYDEALADINFAIQLKPASYIAFNTRGNLWSAQGRHQDALADYERALALEPRYANAHYNRGNTYARLERYQEAIASYNRAIELEPAHAKAYTDRGQCFAKLGRYEDALADYARAIELNPIYGLAYFNRGNALFELGRYDQAIAAYTRSIELDPSFLAAYTNRGDIYTRLHRYDEALSDLDKVIEHGAGDAEAFNNRALAYARIGRYEQALVDFNRALELEPDNLKALRMRAKTYVETRRFEDALADYNRAIELHHSDTRAYQGRADLFMAWERYDKAFADYENVIKLAPTNGPAFLNMGVIAAQHGGWHEALLFFEQAERLGEPQAATFAATAREMIGNLDS